MKPFSIKQVPLPILIFLGVLLVFLAYGGYRYYTLNKEYKSAKAELGNKISDIERIEKKISDIELEKTSLSDALYAEQSKNAIFKDQIDEITGTIGTLEKLSQTDPELLKKYSKVYFLNEHYEPSKLANIDSKYLSDSEDEQFIHSEVRPFLKKLLDSAANKDLNLKIVSGFRSFGEQTYLKSGYAVTYGAGTANQFSADQGYSEHQLGTTVDFTNSAIGATLTDFEKSAEYAWLLANAYKYGFILSYPEGNAYYQYEPWHWRFVGDKLAKKLHQDKANFYDMDQREIDQYLINLFD
ncbi:MAG: M15 family metallopeptidase [Patescibacteria group bacterium]